jgi:thioredoxin-like negative regulator of GroEL
MIERRSVLLAASLCLLIAAAPATAAATWFDRGDAAFAEARKSGKLVLVDLYADWCGWCKVMDKEVFSTPEFAAFAQDYVLLRVDVEDGGEGAAIQRRFRAESLPTLLLLDGKGAYVGDIQGFQPTDKLIARVRSVLGKYQFAVGSYEKALAGSDPAAWERKAIEFHQRGDGARAAALFEKLLAAPSGDAAKDAWRRYLLADSRRLDRDFAAATRALGEAEKAARAAGGDAQLLERVEWLGFALARDARDCARAQGALARLEKDHPASPLVAEARRDWTSLKTAAQCS